MYLFLIIFLLIYSGIHFYAFLKVRAAFAPGTAYSLSLIIFMSLMVFTPFIVRISEGYGFEHFARILSYAGFTWMGILFLFLAFSVTLDIFRLIVYSAGLILGRSFSFLKLPALFCFLAPFIISILIAGYGSFEAGNIRTENIVIKTSKIPESIGSFKIVQISDVHIGLIVREERLKRILREVKAANPDMLVSTGDLVDGQINNLSALVKFFKEIKPMYGKYAITGNHEFYAGLNQALGFIKEAGFTILRGKGLTVEGLINIAGVDDRAGKPYGLFTDVPEKELLSRFSGENFTVLLKHRPDVNKDAVGLFDLQLSGHTHKGQIFPFSLGTKLFYPVDSGLSEIANNAYLYVSRGSGTWGPPIRFLSPPEVTVIELVHE